jgi:hypothetical protein
MYVCFLLNNTWCDAIDDVPIRMSTGSTNDISPLLCFHFWEPVYYKFDDSDFPSDSREKRGHFVGISESVGHAMTFKILTDDTLKVIHRSNVRSALNPHAKNLRLDPLEPGNIATPIVKSRHDSADDGEILPPMPVIDPSELIGRTFLMKRKTGNDIVHESLMLSMKRRFANVLANTNVNSSGNLDTYNLFALSMMMTTKRSFPTMS